MPTLRGKFRDYKLAQYKRKVNNLSSNKEKLGGRNIRKQRGKHWASMQWESTAISKIFTE